MMRKIIIDLDICNGRPLVEGTRIPVHTILEFLAAGDTIDDVLREYPALCQGDVLECIAYAARLAEHPA